MTDRKKYHADWRARNRQHVNRYSRDYTDRNKEQRKQSTKAFRERDKVKPESVIKQLLRTARTNAKKKNVIFDLDFKVVHAIILSQCSKCALTGIDFDYANYIGIRFRPFAPSIDRRDNARGYTYDSIQIVCAMVNRAKNECSQEMFDAMCIARAEKLNRG